MKLVNLTPHTINWYKQNGEVMEIPSSGLLRCKVESKLQEAIDGLQIYRNTYSFEDVLPEEEQGTYYIVSSIVANAVKELKLDRDDIIVVNDSVRDENGRIVGCKSFARI